MFTGVGLGLLIGVTLSMAGIYRRMVDDAQVMLDNTGADLWVVQQGTQAGQPHINFRQGKPGSP